MINIDEFGCDGDPVAIPPGSLVIFRISAVGGRGLF